jgi:NDP-sugar pyrophosphorylase family protein
MPAPQTPTVPNLPDLSVAVLAGGLGTRLRAVVADRPKVLAAVAGRPFLCHLFNQLHDQGVCRVVLLVGHRADQVRAALGASYRGVRLVYSAEDRALGTAGAVRLALPLLSSSPVLLLNGDSYCDVDLDAFRRAHEGHGAGASLVLCRATDPARFGSVELDERGCVLRFVEKEAPGHGPPRAGWINAGVYLLRRDLIAELPPGQPLSLERNVLPAWVGRGQVHGHRAEGRFLDIGTPESYAAAEAFFAGPP